MYKNPIILYENNPYYANNETYFNILVDLVKNNLQTYVIKLKKLKNKDIYDWINNSLPLLSDPFYKLNTKCHWILAGLVDFPRCLNNQTHVMTFRNVNVTEGYPKYCCNRCQVTSKEFKEQRIKTWKENYGDEITTSPSLSKIVRKKQEQTCLKNNGVKFPMQSKEIFEHGRLTKLIKYKDKNYVNPTKALETKRRKYNGKLESDEATEHRKLIYANTLEKQYKTKKKNKSFKASKLELLAKDMLTLAFDNNNVVYQYRSDEYPFMCDFYIKSLDLYIECNFHWTHGGHWFDLTNANDLAIVLSWKDKDTQFYRNAIDTWTVRDVKKYLTAKLNKLNYIAFWTIDELKTWINELIQSK